MRRFPGALATVLVAGMAHAAESGDPVRGGYLATIMDCAGCHTPRAPDGSLVESQHLAGGTIGFAMPGLGTFWPTNLTPDATGLKDWSAEDIATALRTGMRPDGRELAPIMPWRNYAALTDEDLADLIAYLRSLEPIGHKVPDPLGEGEKASAPYYLVMVPGG